LRPGIVLRFMGEAAAPDNDGDGFAGADDPDDTDPCNPDNNVTVCDTDGDGTPDGSDPYPTCAGTPDDGCDLTTDTFDDACVAVNTADCAAGTTFDAATCTCTTDAVPGCTDDTACNYDSNATEDDGSCTFLPAEPTDLACYETATANLETCSWDVAGDAPNVDDGCDITTDTLDDATCMAVNTPNCAAGESFDADACACTTNPVPGCTDANACNYDMNATEDDGSCVSVEAATIAGGPFTFCVGDDTSDFVSDITNDGGSGSNSAWVITDDQLNILGLPPMPGAVDFNAVAAGTCLIWYVVFEDITGANIGDNAGDLGGCFALSNSIEVIREQAGCTDPAASNYNPDAQCDDGSCETTSTGCTSVSAQNNCLNVCPEQAALLSVSGEDGNATNAVVCIDQLTGANVVIQNGSDLSALPEALYSCYTVAVSNSAGAFDISSATYSIDNIQMELDMALMSSDNCGSVGAAKNFDINSSYCSTSTCMLNVCSCNEESNEITFVYTPVEDAGNDQFLLIDAAGNIVALSPVPSFDASVLSSGTYSIYALIYDPAISSNLPVILSSGGTLADVEAELAAAACGSLSAPITATVTSDCCTQAPLCVTDVCPCNGDDNVINLATTGYTEGDNEQWYIVVSSDGIVTTQQASGSGTVLFAGLPDGSHQIYAVNYDPVANPEVTTALANGGSWSDVVTSITNGTLCAGYIGPQDISINSDLCDCMMTGDCEAVAGEIAALDPSAYCDSDDVDLTLSVSSNQTDAEYGTLIIITTDDPLTSDIYDIVGIAEATAIGSGMYNLGSESDGYFNILGLEPGDYCVHSVNYASATFNPANDLQIIGAGGFITSLDALIAIASGNVCAEVNTTTCQAFSIYEEITFDASANCDASDLDNFSISISNISGGSGSGITVGSSDGTIADNGDGTYSVTGIANGTMVSLSVGDNACSASAEITGNCFDVDCPAEATADASNQAACDGDAISLSVNNVIGASGIATSDYTLSWTSSDASIDVSDAGNVVVSNTACTANEVVFTAILVCLDGTTTISSDINVTIYPSSIDAFISFTGEGTCDPRIEVDSSCDGIVLSSFRTPASIAPDSSGSASWEVTYAYQGSNTPLPGACNLNQSVETTFSCAPVCPTPAPFVFTDVVVCSGSSVSLPVLVGVISTENSTGDLYADYTWTTSDGSFSSSDGGVNSVTLENTDCAPKVTTFNYSIGCTLDGSVVRAGSFDVSVYPTDISSFVTLDEGDGCIVSLLPNAGCEPYVAGDAFTAAPGENGTVSLTASYIGSDCAANYSIDANYDCAAPILCDAGSISGGAVTFACQGETAIVQSADAIGFISYILHNGDDTNIGEQYASSLTGVFTNDGTLPLNVELCISAVAGSSQLSNGLPDPNGDCYDISNCARIVFITPIDISIVENCDETTGLVTISATVSGGAPEYLPEVHSYGISGSIDVDDAISGDTFEIGPLSPGDEYVIFVDNDGKGCSESYVNVVGSCAIGAECDGGTIAAGANFVCDGEFSIFTASDTGGSITYVLHNGNDSNIGDVYATSPTGVFTNDGNLPLNVEVCVTSVASSSLDSSGIPDPNGDCYDLSNCAKVVFLSPIVVEFNQTCNPATGGDVSANMTYSITILDDGKGCEGEYSFTATPCDIVVDMPSISLDKIANDDGITTPAIVGQVIFYSFTVCNTGSVDLTNVTVSDILVPVQGGPISLAVGECDETTFTASYTISAEDIAAGQVYNSATTSGTSSPGGEKVTSSDDAIVPLVPATCNNDAGIMPSDLMNVCYGGYANVTTTNASIDGGSSLTYVLYDGSDNILDYNATGLFLNDGSYPYNTELHICAVAAPTNGGLPNFDADCVDISNCTPVVYLAQIIIDIEVSCYGDGRFDVIFTVNGGMPSAYSTSQYTVTGDFNGLVVANNPTVVGPFDAASLYSFYITDENNCGASAISQSIVCEKLPIDLISYTGEVKAQGNMLNWVTATETENAYFTMAHSTDGNSFTSITKVDGAGTVSEPQSYSFLHRDAPAGISYYKLWQTDFNGTKNYVGIVGLTRGEVSLNITSIQPIPVLEYMELTYTSISETQAELQIFDALGRNMTDISILSNTGINNRTIDVSSFTPGIYFLTINQGDDTVTEKFIKE